MSLNINSDISIRDQWAQQLAIYGVQEEWNKLVLRDPNPDRTKLLTGDTLPRAPSPSSQPVSTAPFHPPPPPRREIKVGIVGAGAAGLFTGLVFDYLNMRLHQNRTNLKFGYDILESTSADRLGGRLFTYSFGGERDTHDYYDVGAMRFPDNPVMKRTFELFEWLGMKKDDLKTNPDAEDGSLIPYYMENGDAGNEPWCYNDINKWGTYEEIREQAGSRSDPFRMSADHSIPRDILQYSPDDVMKNAIEPFREKLKEDARRGRGRAGWKLLMKYDTFSTRQFLGTSPPEPLPESDIPPPPYNYATIEWMETFNGGSNWYDQAHSETVLESLDFEFGADTNWYCVLGGVQMIAKNMVANLQTKPTYNSPVTAIRALRRMHMEVDIKTTRGHRKRTYAGVFNTTTLGCLKRMDLRHAGLNYATKQAIRSLGYGPAAKVGIKFKRAWWIHDLGKYSVKMGGLGHSDLTIRTCVYPSYNIYDGEDKTAVLLCSYTWQQDSERISSLMSTNADHEQKVCDEAELRELLIRELVRLHKNDDMSPAELYNLINDNYIDHHAFDWYKDPNAVGAFAFFRPQQFSNMWNKMIQPSGDLVLVGEACSPHHAWVVGALESVVHGIHAWLALNRGAVPEMEDAMRILEKPIDGIPFVGLPLYMDPNISRWHGVLGMDTRDKHLNGMGSEGPSMSDVLAQLPSNYNQ